MKRYTATDLAERWDCSREMVLKLARSHRLGHLRVGRLYRFTDEHVAAFEASNEHKPVAEEPKPIYGLSPRSRHRHRLKTP